MNNSFYRIANQLIDWTTGFDINNALKKSIAFDYQDREQIEHYQKQQFLKLSSFASSSEYYSDYANSSIEDFPLMGREDYYRLLPGLFTNQSETYFKRRATGSTKFPVTHHITKEMLLAKRVSHQKMLRWHGISRESSEMKLGGAPVGFKWDLYYQLKNKRFVNSYQISKETIPQIARKYNRFKPEVLYGYPAVINLFIMMAKMAGIELHAPRLIVVHGENLYQDVKERFMEMFPESRIANQYWATEACIAETCPQGNLHIAEDTVICEVINPDETGRGDLYITNLFSYAVPYIRYKLGDRIILSDTTCSCGRNTKVIDTLLGREMEYFELPDGQKYPLTATHYSHFTKNMLAYQLLYYKKQKKITIKYVPLREDLAIMEDDLTAYWSEHFHLQADFLRVPQLEYSAGGKSSKLINME